MSWQKLKEHIQSVKPDEFEELVAKLLTSFLKIPFAVARRGDQPSGDARSLGGDVSLQAKRYTGENLPNAKFVEGDIRQVIRTLPHLQVYVLAVSRDVAQLWDTLDAIQEDTGVDIVTIELEDKLSELGALCVTFWEEICHLFDSSNSDHEFLAWIEKVRHNSELEKKLDELKPKLERGIQTQSHVKKDTEEYLLDRFSSNEGFNPINLSQAIDRQEIESEIDNWWESDSVPICYLQGEEGTGKTWLAAKWMNSIHQNDDCVAFWLDSKDWRGCGSIFDLFNSCFSLIYPSYEHGKIKKLQNKPAKIWRKTLIVLDGVNERNAIKAAQQILDEYFRHESKWKDRIRFLFTTRHLNDYLDFEKDLWGKCHKIQVTPYNDTELHEALSIKGMQLQDLPASLKEIAKIPRYFQTCIRLRDRFGSFETVTKELVLWVDLLDKIERTDPQLKQKLGWHKAKDAQAILSELAKQAIWTNEDGVPKTSVQVLLQFFPNYHEIRHDLEEQRIVLDAGLVHANLSSEHIILGWALYFSNLFDSREFTEINEFVECLNKVFEPIPSEDLRTRALFDALHILALSPDSDTSKKQAALMFAWFNSHNAQITNEHLSVCVENYTDAYCQVVELEFKNQILRNEEDPLIEPLAKIWRNKKGQLNDLASRLTKWLLPTYTDEKIKVGDNIDPKSLPFPTMYYTQIRLATAALSILSQRPERQFLSTLANCHAIHEQTPQFNENIGRLMRWGYTETVLGDLYWLAELAKHDDFLSKGVYGLTVELKLVSLPCILQRPLSEKDKEIRALTEQWKLTYKSPFNRLRDQERILKGDSAVANVEGSYHGLDYLAVRTDLPDLRTDDYVKIKEVLQHITENVEWGKSRSPTLEDSCVENLTPWFAKNNPQDFSEFACNFMINCLSPDYQVYMLRYVQGIIFHQNDSKRISKAILEIKECLTKNIESSLLRVCMFTEILLFCASEEILTKWFIFLASQEPLRSSICNKSLVNLFENLLPDSIVELAQNNLEELRNSSHEDQDPSEHVSEEFSEEEYWCALFAYGSKVENKTVEYALDDLKMRKPDSIGTFPMLRLAYSDPKLLLDEILIDKNIQNHMLSENGRKWTIHTYDGNDVPSYEHLRSFMPIEFVGSFLIGPSRCADLSQWGKDIMKRLFSILDGNEGDSNSVEENQYGINREVFQTWAEQNQNDFLQLSDKYLTELSKSPWYQQVLSTYTDVIYCLLLRFQPEKAIEIYQELRSENIRTIHYDQPGIESFLAQLWKVNQCNTPEHVKLRRNLLEEYENDEEAMFMTIAAMAGGGEKELLDLVEKEYLESNYAKERNLGVSILPWFGSDDVIKLLDQLKSDDPSLWVRGHAAWAYEVAQQERSCKTVYRDALQTRDLFKISAAFEQMKPALSPTARLWHREIEEELGLISAQDLDPKLIALVDRFWCRWGNSSKTRRNIEIFGRKLKEYCRGEKLGFGSPPRLAPWWKPT